MAHPWVWLFRRHPGCGVGAHDLGALTIGDADRGDEVETLGDRIEVAFVSCWLVHGGAIAQDQADRLDRIYAYRHSLTHELVKHLIDPDLDPDVELFVDAM
jgi:hypothetical protein